MRGLGLKMKSAKARHVISPTVKTNFWLIFFKCIGWLLIGGAAGFAFFYFFKDFSVTLIDKYKFIQGIFGIKQYQPGTVFLKVLLTILAGNLISTAAYFAIGWLRALIPASILTGFVITIILFTGTIRNLQTAIPLEVIVLVCVEALYRCLALTAGEHLAKNRLRKKAVFISSVLAVVFLLAGAALYEVYQIFGYILQ
jgi:hypothetical protein